VAGSGSTEPADVDVRELARGEGRIREEPRARTTGPGGRIEGKVEGCPEPVVPLIIGVIP